MPLISYLFAFFFAEFNLDTPVDELAPLLARDLYRVIDEAPYRAYANLLSHMVVATRQSSGVIINTFDAIESTQMEYIYRDISIPVFAMGPLHMISPYIDSSLLLQDKLSRMVGRPGTKFRCLRELWQPSGDRST